MMFACAVHGTFRGASAFNHPLLWSTGRVVTMQDTFAQAASLNQHLEWDVSSVASMQVRSTPDLSQEPSCGVFAALCARTSNTNAPTRAGTHPSELAN